MENQSKKERFKHIGIGFVCGFVVSAVAFIVAATLMIAPLLKNVDIKTLQRINKCQEMIDETALYDFDRELAQDRIIKGYVSGMDDIYADYYTLNEWNEMEKNEKGDEFCGIGATLTVTDSGSIMVVSLIDGGGAIDAGLKPGSIIKKVDGVSVTGKDLQEVVDTIRGIEDTSVTLLVDESGTDKEYTIIRKKMKDTSVTSEILDNNIGYIMVDQFIEISDEYFIEALKKMSDSGVDKLIIDLRDNGGGDVASCGRMIDALIDEGVIITMKTNNPESDVTYMARDGVEFKGDIIVLVNENTASASEIFTGVLKQYGVIRTVGTLTFGKGIVQDLMGLNDIYDLDKDEDNVIYVDDERLDSGYEGESWKFDPSEGVIKLTSAEWLLPNGECIHGIGITPDYVVELESGKYNEEGIDEQLEKAIELLME